VCILRPDVTSAKQGPPRWRRAPIWLAAALGLAAVAVASVLALRQPGPGVGRTSLTAGPSTTARASIARALAAELSHQGIEASVVECRSTRCELEAAQARAVDFALVSGVVERSRYPDLREVAPLFVEGLHLLVKAEFAGEFEDGTLGALRGRRVDLGPPESATAWLSEEVLHFAGVPCTPAPSPETCGAERYELDQLLQLATDGRRDELPDAVFHLATVPSKIASELIQRHAYALVPLPFAHAFRLGEMLSNEDAVSAVIERRYTSEYVIPPYLYGPSPPIPSEPLPTIGARLVVVAHRDLSPALVEKVVETVFGSRFAHVPDPSLHRSIFQRTPHAGLHEGTLDYLARDEPIIAASDVDGIANTLSVLGALLGAGVFVWQAWRQRERAARDRIFGGYQLEIAAVERGIAELELSAQLELDSLVELQRKVLQLKSDALTRFAAGELGDPATLTDLLSPLNAARDHVGDLLLHVRERLEKQALEQGRSAEAMWEEAIEGSDEPAD
jgi:TRAP-type uncharacterized transport system substrate-binding protein